MDHFLCIHGHFYQPPRENPWLEAIEIQDSAYPYHDWNERITAECYAPNADARFIDGDGKITSIVNNYARISFNFGPTLLAWMEAAAPVVYQAILEADRESRERFSGHGSAIAQAYNHMIMPLANRRDKVTQVKWGVRDFEHRFGRRPEGMWLPETAVDLETLDILAEHGIRYTILSPYQAGQVRIRGGRKWHDATGGRIDPTRPYEQLLPSGRRIAIFFYDGPISQGIAFERLLIRGEDFAGRLMGAFSDDRKWPQIVHIATDGETYGHHHRHGEMALAHAIRHIEESGFAGLTNYGEYLERFPKMPRVEIVENTAWSCVHGVGRWMSDCGCNSGRAGWHQQWRAPLREALDWLRDSLAPLYESAAGELLKDPWAARDDYIEVILDRSPENVSAALARHSQRPLSEEERVRALKLLELQRHAMLMYTSCGWFFDDLSGIETVQVIEYAGHALQLADDLFDDQLEEEFVQRLANAKSNLPEHGDGKAIYEKWVRPTKIDISKVTSHYAASTLFEDYGEAADIYCYEVQRRSEDRRESGRARLAVGHCRVTSKITREAAEVTYAAVHLGDHNLIGGVRMFAGDDAYRSSVEELCEPFEKGDTPETIRRLDHQFAGVLFSLATLFREEQRKILDLILDSARSQAEGAFRQLHDQHAPMMNFLADLGTPIPVEFRAPAQVVLQYELKQAVHESPPDTARIMDLLERARRWQAAIDEEGLRFAIRQLVEKRAEAVQETPGNVERMDEFAAAVELAVSVPGVELFLTQNIVYDLLAAHPVDAVGDGAWRNRLASLAEKLYLRPRPVGR